MVAKEPFIRTGKILRDDRVFLLDAPIFPGNSGGAVFSFQPFGTSTLIGLISASQVKLGFAVAEPVSRITETIEHVRTLKTPIEASWHLLH